MSSDRIVWKSWIPNWSELTEAIQSILGSLLTHFILGVIKEEALFEAFSVPQNNFLLICHIGIWVIIPWLSLSSKARGNFRIFIMVQFFVLRSWENGVTSHVHRSPHFLPIPVKLEGIIIILVAQNLPTRFLISCLEAEIFKFKAM